MVCCQQVIASYSASQFCVSFQELQLRNLHSRLYLPAESALDLCIKCTFLGHWCEPHLGIPCHQLKSSPIRCRGMMSVAHLAIMSTRLSCKKGAMKFASCLRAARAFEGAVLYVHVQHTQGMCQKAQRCRLLSAAVLDNFSINAGFCLPRH